MVNITIDGKKMNVEESLTILEAARQANIDIPTLCDHETLTPYGGCRLCVVEVEGARTLQPSCTLPVSRDMVVRTDTERVRSARKFILTMIFSERNHFCPYCNVTGGDCELQNSAYAEDMTHWPIQPNWQPYPVDASHPFILLEHNRCILCRRCVRACNELVGNFTLEFADRGANSMLVADLDVPLGESSCISCGTCMQVCPTGTLIDKWSAYQGNCENVEKTNTICQQCSVGCNINVLTRDNRLVRIEGDWDGKINGGVICEAGRFLPMVEPRNRLKHPMIRKKGTLVESSWKEALETIDNKIGQTTGKKVGIASTKLSLESLDVFKQICVSKGFSSISATEGGDFTQAGFSHLTNTGKPFESKLSQIEDSDCFLVLGEDLTKDHQVVSFFIKRTLPKGAKLVQISSVDDGFGIFADASLDVSERELPKFLDDLAEIIKSGSDEKTAALSKKYDLEKKSVSDTVEYFKNSKSPMIILGSRDKFSNTLKVYESAAKLADELKASFLSTKGNINSLGAAQLEINNAIDIADANLVVIAIGDEILTGDLNMASASNTYSVVISAYESSLTKDADVVLPVANWLEESGHFLNLDGHLLEANAALVKPEGSRTNIDALTQLASVMKVEIADNWNRSFENQSIVEIEK